MNTVDIKVGTEAHHKLGDISREDGDFFHAEHEDKENYYGRWLSGFGFVNVRFPKSGVRELTDDERDTLSRGRVVIL